MKKLILCLDDAEIILDSLKVQLKNALPEEYIYEFSEDAEDALEIIDEYHNEGIKILIIVSDWLMPTMKGDVFLIRVHDKYPEIVKIMLTGQADEKAITRAYKEANLYKLIKKPWEKEELIQTIKEGIGLVD